MKGTIIDFMHLLVQNPELARELEELAARFGFEFTDEVGDEELFDASKAAAIHDVILDFANGYETIVGEKGVFAVETCTRLKGSARTGSQEATVNYDGRMLVYTDKSDFETIEQAEKQADWLSQWLAAATGEPIAVRAVVALPGWVVKRTSADGIPVVNPGQFGSLFDHIKPRPLSETMLTGIKEQLEDKCRNH